MSHMSQMSGMSTYQTGRHSTIESSIASSLADQEPEENETFRIIFAITGICLFMGLIGFIGFMLLGSTEAEEPEVPDLFASSGGGSSGGGSSGGGSSGGGSLPASVPVTTPRAATPGPGPSGQGPPSSGGAPPAVQPPPVIQPPVAPPPAIPPPVGPSPPVAPPPVAPPPVTPPPVAPPPVAPPPVAPPPVAPPKVTPPPTPKPKVTQPPVPPPTRRPPPPKPPTPTTKPTTTPRPFSVDELVCTVGRTAFYAEVYPPDGLCHHIYYRDVAVVHGALIGVEIMSSWEMFKMVMMKYTKTSGGMAFDVRYASPTSLNATVEKELDMLASKNVKNYAVLNVLEVPDKLSKLYNDAKPLLMKLKNLQGSDKKRKTLIGIGILNYKLSNAMSRLRDIFNDAVNQHVADTVIAYSSVGWIESRKECYSHPPSVFDRRTFDQSAAVEAARMPEIRSIATLMTRDKTFTSDTKMGLSFELGTLAYNLRQPGGTFDSVNAHCSLMYVTKYDVLPCKLDVFANRNELFQGVNVADVPKDTKKVFLFEDDATITKKCNNLAQNSTYLRHGMSLLLNNVDLGDFTKNGSCADDADRQDPFVRIRIVRAVLKIP